MSEINTWNTTAANNNAPSPDGWPENMNYNAVNNSARENMAATARLYADMNGTLATTGSSNTYALVSNRTLSAYASGLTFKFSANHTNTGAATLNVSTLGAKDLKTADNTALSAGDIVSGRYYQAVYNGTYFVLMPEFTPNEVEKAPSAYIYFTLNGTATPTVSHSKGCTVALNTGTGAITVTLTTAIPTASMHIEQKAIWTGAFGFLVPVTSTLRPSTTTTINGGVVDNTPAALDDTCQVWVKVFDYS